MTARCDVEKESQKLEIVVQRVLHEASQCKTWRDESYDLHGKLRDALAAVGAEYRGVFVATYDWTDIISANISFWHRKYDFGFMGWIHSRGNEAPCSF